jgi:hypothetical protein
MMTAFKAATLCALLLIPIVAYPQVTLTGAIQFSTNSTGAAYGGLLWNTLGGDSYYDLWLAENPNATSPVNGPSDAQSDISIPLQSDNAYRYYIFGQPGPGLITGFNGLNLFFDGNNSTPGISVFGATNGSSFLPTGGATLTLQGTSVAGSGTSFFSTGGVVVVLAGYTWNAPATPPGDVAQAFAFTPASGDVPDYFGSFTLEVWPAATLNLSQTGGPPGTKLTTTGSGFAPTETVAIYANRIGGTPLLTTTTDANGNFTVSSREPQIPYGPISFYAAGQTNGKLGAASYFVTAAMVMTPGSGVPGDAITAHGVGFGAGEEVSVYWNEPRQLLGTTTANAQGGTSLQITIPANAATRGNKVFGVGQTTSAIGSGGILVK